MGSHYLTISGSSHILLYLHSFFCAPKQTWSFLLLCGTFPEEYHNLIKKSFLLFFMLTFSQATNTTPLCCLPNEFNITFPQADYLWAMNFFLAPEVPHSCYSKCPGGNTSYGVQPHWSVLTPCYPVSRHGNMPVYVATCWQHVFPRCLIAAKRLCVCACVHTCIYICIYVCVYMTDIHSHIHNSHRA